MKNFYFILLFFLLVGLTLSIKLNAQNGLVKRNLSKNDIKTGVIAFYAPEHKDFAGSRILLYKNKTFHYETWTDFTGTQFSEGKWTRKGKYIILNSSLDSENIPVTVKYTNDKIDQHKTNISIIKNLKGDILFYTYVHINNNKITCLPYFDTCMGPKFEKIDSIKVELENEYNPLNSKWIKIEDVPFSQIQITVDLNFDPLNYIAIYNDKWKIEGKYLRYIKNTTRL